MTLDILIIFAGSFVAVLPFLGFPSSWDTVLFFIAGIFVIGLGIAVQRRGSAGEQRKNTETVENPSPSNTHDTL
ncbi:MAG: hypothetical protein UY39_C0009G0010 [Candidatus Kaiserbacteria bacterium GW2011_GWC2_49_12]|uniref:Uncharacterized protein n=4 Tax=Candidatus Kaiseribacteriota TaxID=1752734 RepID=A0A0G1YRZ0_9BACT|nr:MAG: hypothetical protein UY39_C0009G0010 [Candidatus Kaiserbacteria bacterium GW2011_GWC2_49_12]KKW17787.1 MAG: hypothetical protein UY57_C0010G0017 [Candidatus Kaiserbacteria bacterium GW2011_GWB1_50_17]KKW18361.1 MAG: hypothetical protein UY59_C0008G0017 [Candidatus Kaiserbacteria bacterium GW2011_GWA1_50_28]OGG87979.1 MAG: hypothetical protein A3H15_00705 [Candidatus Kaiserbacteria bacterium RIFCSPLOWO2_12_FULL_50_28]HCM43850.1 hypothetical protein [Candidatus Kaiserbacteria bacterium]